MKKITEKEQKLIEMIGKGMTNEEIAKSLNVTKNTVGVYIYNLCRLTGAKNRIELFNKLKEN